MSYEDTPIVCRDCGTTFIFTAGEQEFYAQKGFMHAPVRCPTCRRARKQSRRNDQQRTNTGQNKPDRSSEPHP
ncbi:MAG: cytochrome C551 [Chloroflexaceae bacterium]|nr:cytochrome C551 [Chloroflexaceae bacterium]